MNHKKVLEAALFISNSPLTLDQLARVSGINSLGHVKEIMEGLQREYSDSGLEIVNTPEGWSMQVRPQVLPRVAHLTPYSDLGEGHKRTLALVTLKEPVKQAEIIRMQGNKAYSYIKELTKRGLIVSEKQGHTKILKLTLEFERYFGEEKSKIKAHIEKHLEGLGKEGEPVYEEPGARSGPSEGEVFDFLEERRPGKAKARVSVIQEDAAREIPAEEGQGGQEEGQEGKEGEDQVEEGEAEPKKKARARALEASHEHAFEEIE